MRQVLKTMGHRLKNGEDMVLVTIIAASGATPRGMGAHMLVGREGRLEGTIGGGAVEYRCEQLALQVLEEKDHKVQEFSLTKNDVQNLGMICGGTVRVFFAYLPGGEESAIALAGEAEEKYLRGMGLWLICDLKAGGALSLYTRQEGFFGHPCPQWIKQYLGSKPALIEEEGMSFCVEQINSPGRVYVFGGGHVSQELVPLLSRVGFRCVVLEDRPEFAKKELFPGAEEILLVDFEQIREAVAVGEEDYVCIMTRGHAWDTVVQAQLLSCRPSYLGVIGSRSKAAGVRDVLRETYGMTEELLDQVITPIGLSIGAETPAEIAVSIAAQMIAHRAGADVKKEWKA
ncbi:MAG: XdhC family protein [Lachnospiraceae bacterium]|nr:XdhC family protein [Lachnospiraceae bacterium]